MALDPALFDELHQLTTRRTQIQNQITLWESERGARAQAYAQAHAAIEVVLDAPTSLGELQTALDARAAAAARMLDADIDLAKLELGRVEKELANLKLRILSENG